MGFVIERTCTQCRQTFQLDVTQEQLTKWRAGGLIQNVMPNLTSGERELLVSGICGRCFDDLFKDSE